MTLLRITILLFTIIAGSISVFSLLAHSINFGIASAIQIILEYYSNVLDFLLSWATPYIQAVVDFVLTRFDIDVLVYEHWQHVFVLLLLYVSRDAVVTWIMPGVERKLAAIAIIMHGLPISLFFSALSASSSISDPKIQIVTYPVLGMLLYNFIKCFWDATLNRFSGVSWSQTFTHHFLWIVLLNACAGVVAYLFAKVLVLTGNGELSIVALVVFLMMLAVRHYIVAWYVSDSKLASVREIESNMSSTNSNTWIEERKAHKSLGASVALPILGAIIFLIINAGLNLIS